MSTFIAFYGVNRTGKSTQRKLLADRLFKERGTPVLSLKFALDSLEPVYSMLNGYLRGGNPYRLTPREFQILNVLNRTQAMPEITAARSRGEPVVAEDYFGTGVAWGVAEGLDRDFLLLLNKHLPKPDISILLDGDQFASSKEENHRYETNDNLTQRAREVHRSLANSCGWRVIPRSVANASPEEVHEHIWRIVSECM